MPFSKFSCPFQTDSDITEAAALPMAVETAARSIDLLPLTAGQTLMVNGGGTMTGFAAVQIALLRGAARHRLGGRDLCRSPSRTWREGYALW